MSNAVNQDQYDNMKKIKDALDALQGIKYEEGIGFVQIDKTEVAKPVTKKESAVKTHPNPKNHLIVSLAKSALRIMAGCFLFASIFKSAAVLFIVAELLGILEELV